MWISPACTAYAAPFIFPAASAASQEIVSPRIMTDSDQTKDTLRREALSHRARIDRSAEDSIAACRLFFETIAPTPNQSVAAYWPHGTEFSPLDILHELLRRDMPCALPAMRPNQSDRVLDFLAWDESIPLEKGPFGILQPQRNARTRLLEPDIIIVPLLAFDRKGYRLGHGKGYYDATLSALRQKKPVLAVGLAFAQQAVLFNLPRQSHDIPLDWIITPQGVQRFSYTP